MLKKLFLLLYICLILAGCSEEPAAQHKKFSSQIFAMDTVMNLTIYGEDGSALEDAGHLVNDLDQALSTTDKHSEIYTLNHTGSASLSPETARLMTLALDFCKKTDGALDISIYPVVQAWGFTTGSYHIPQDEALQELCRHVDYRKIRLSQDGSSVNLPDGMEIDLGSVAKGFTGDAVAELFRKRGISSALLNLGGNIQALGSKPDGSSWKVGIQDPLSSNYLGVLEISDQAVITSGGYERYFKGPDGQIYWHIIDPATGKPARNGLISATAVGKEGVYCDALSTSLFIMGEEKASIFWTRYQDFEMILVTDDGRIVISPGLADIFQLAENTPYTLQVIDHD